MLRVSSRRLCVLGGLGLGELGERLRVAVLPDLPPELVTAEALGGAHVFLGLERRAGGEEEERQASRTPDKRTHDGDGILIWKLAAESLDREAPACIQSAASCENLRF